MANETRRNLGSVVTSRNTKSSGVYDSTETTRSYHGTYASDARTRTQWTDSEKIIIRQLVELVNAAKQELQIRSNSTAANQIVSKSSGTDIETNDFNQMISRVAKLKTIATMGTGTFIDSANDLIPIRRALNESQAECICNCNYYCTCNAQCTCYHECSCNLECTCYDVCTCNQQCSCNLVCTCNCNNCSCNYSGGPKKATITHSDCYQHTAKMSSTSTSGCAGHSWSCSGHYTHNLPSHTKTTSHPCGHIV